MIQIYTNCYSPNITPIEKTKRFDFKNSSPELYEFPAFLDFYESGLLDEAEYSGLVSPKFTEKTGLSIEEVENFIESNPGYDCYFFNPFSSIIYTHYNTWLQGERCHPGLIEIASKAIKETHNIDINQIGKSTEQNLLFCNYWVGNKKFWDTYIDFSKKVSEYLLNNEKDNVYKTTYHYGQNKDIFYPFIIERIFSIICEVMNNLKVVGIQIDDTIKNTQNYGKQLINLTRLNHRLGTESWDTYNQDLLKGYFFNLHRRSKDFQPPKLTKAKKKLAPLLYKINLGGTAPITKEIETMIIEEYLKFDFELTNEIILPRVFLITYLNRPDLQTAFDIQTEKGTQDFFNWCCSSGVIEILGPLLKRKVKAVEVIKPELTNGVNLIGYYSKMNGLAEDMRNFEEVLKKAGVNYEIHEIDYINQTFISERNPKYKTNILFLPPSDVYRFKTGNEKDVMSNYYNIGYMPWEFSKWSKNYEFFVEGIDEIWAISDFIKQSYESLNRKTVKINSLFKFDELGEPPENKKSNGLNFLYIFDSNSNIHRKNPMVLIEAFKDAFSPDRDDVSLTLKTMNLKRNPKTQNLIQDLIGNDKRIELIDQAIDYNQLVQLMKKCNVYVSPHRCEGLGRTLVEAMYLNKILVATNYSGSTDYCREGYFLPIDYKLTNVNHEYSFTDDDFKWADPSKNSLIKILNDIDKNFDHYKSKAKENSEYVLKKYSPSSNIDFYKELLKDLGISAG